MVENKSALLLAACLVSVSVLAALGTLEGDAVLYVVSGILGNALPGAFRKGGAS